MIVTACRYHDFSYGHRVFGHENKCGHLHGHNGRVHFFCSASELDYVGRIMDFGVINALLCQWVEENWDHKFLIWMHDSLAGELATLDNEGVAHVPFNPTAENMARHLLEVVGPERLAGTGVELIEVVMEETRKCSASAKR